MRFAEPVNASLDARVLVVTDCPHQALAEDMLRRALDDAGLTDVPVRTALLTDGLSPSFLIDGADPLAVDGSELSATAAGGVDGVACRLLGPAERDQIAAALFAAARAARRS